MPEVLEEQNLEPLDMRRYLEVARRRYPHFLLSAFLGWLIVWGIGWILPMRYKSSTVILVEQPSMPKDYVVSNISDDLQGRLQNITEQILSRTRLLHIIDTRNLYGAEHGKLTPDEKAARMRKDIEIELVRDSPDQRITAFKINYSAHDPNVAQQVTSELANLFINENLELRQQQSEDTTKFLGSQLEAARQRLAEEDAKIREFKGEHIGELPSQQSSNLQILGGLQSQLQNEEDALTAAQQQQTYLQTMANQYRALQGSSRTADGAPTGLSAIDAQLSRLKSQLAELSSHYTDRYPDVQNLKIEIAKTEKMRAQVLADAKSKGAGRDAAEGDVGASDGADPTQSSLMLQLEGQLHANRAEIANRERALAELKGRIGEYQARLNDEPAREQQLADLTRDYDQSKAIYDDLLKKENESARATSMEEMQKGEQFRVLDPPSLPLKPDFPNRIAFCGLGLGAGLVLGVLVAWAFEFMDDRMHSEREIKKLLPVKVISEIPEVVNPSDERKSKQKMFLGWAMAVLVVAAILAGSVLSYRLS